MSLLSTRPMLTTMLNILDKSYSGFAPQGLSSGQVVSEQVVATDLAEVATGKELAKSTNLQ